MGYIIFFIRWKTEETCSGGFGDSLQRPKCEKGIGYGASLALNMLGSRGEVGRLSLAQPLQWNPLLRTTSGSGVFDLKKLAVP